MSALGRLWRHNRLALLAFVAATALTVFFTARMMVFSVYWADPAHHNQAIAGWMTPRYIARSWHVPPEAIETVTGGRPGTGHPRTLDQIAADAGVPMADLAAEITAAIAAAKAAERAKAAVKAGRP